MTGYTTKNALPYPEGTDRVVDGDDAIRALAQAVDTKLGESNLTTATLGTGGTVLATGEFEFASTTAIDIRNVFPTGVRFARILISIDGTAVPSGGNFQFIDGSTIISTNYAYQRTIFGTSVAATSAGGQNAFPIWDLPAGGGLCQILLSNPTLGTRKFAQVESAGIASTGNPMRVFGSCDSGGTNYNGFRISGMNSGPTYRIRVQRIM